MKPTFYTVGHSTHALGDFLPLLERHGIQAVADIRRFPGSKKYPQFNAEPFAAALAQAGVEYQWIEPLGGRRGRQPVDPANNAAWRNASFHNYADYMGTPEFAAGIAKLIALGEKWVTAFLCSEGLYWRCHRRLVSDYLTAQGLTVEHILPNGEIRRHELTPGIRVAEGGVGYPLPNQQTRLFEL